MNLSGKNIVVYDLEIKRDPNDCVAGWKSFQEFGISVACAYDYRDSRFRVFMDDNLGALVERLNQPDTLIVGFNHIRFDNEVLRASGFELKYDVSLKNYDLLQISREGAGVEKFAKGFKLDEHLSALGLPMKSGCGSLAPKLYQDKKRGELVDYCLNDVTTEKNLFEYVVYSGVLACAHNNGHPFRVRRPDL